MTRALANSLVGDAIITGSGGLIGSESVRYAVRVGLEQNTSGWVLSTLLGVT